MCGLAGLYAFDGASDDDARHVVQMRDALVHRGPDDAGLHQSADRRAILAHRRLSIVDLSAAGHQPMTNEDGSLWLVCNGEIYNHEELRRELGAKGHRFASRSDCEAILHLYEELGEGCLERLDGMFAFALWDARERRLLLARDRLGKKPLFYTTAGKKLLFASEIRALLRHPSVRRELDEEALDLYLTFTNVPAPRTLFADVERLPAAHAMVSDERGQTRRFRYWSPLAGTRWPTTAHPEECAAEVRRLLERAVEKRLMADVPVGAFLSGGVDSSTNVALMSRLVTEPLRTFSVGFRGFGPADGFNDLPYARTVAARHGCRHEEILLDAEACRDVLPEWVARQDEPIGDPACLPMHFISRAASDAGLKVVLVGEGSDEVFGGYDDMRQLVTRSSPRWRILRMLPRTMRRAIHRASAIAGAPPGRVDLFRRAAEDEPLYLGLEVAFWETEKRALLRAPLRKNGQSAAAVAAAAYVELLRHQPGADVLQQLSYVELQNRLPELLLMRVDRFSMAHSLEARAPFLDHALVAYALSLPAELKIGGGVTKRVLKDAVRPFLPSAILDRPKQGFRVPLPAWLREGPLAAWARGLLETSRIRRRGYFDDGYIDALWRRHRTGAFDHSFDLWCLVNVAAWYDAWIEGRGA